MKNFLVALIIGIIVFFVVNIICTLLGTIPHLELIATYSWAISLLAGLFAFLQRWGVVF